ncbi:hypothetical protein Dimus_021634, partial [Dionaea muscipula]
GALVANYPWDGTEDKSHKKVVGAMIIKDTSSSNSSILITGCQNKLIILYLDCYNQLRPDDEDKKKRKPGFNNLSVKNYFACPDDETFRYLASVYSLSHHNMSLSKEFPGGITNGASWYPIYGGMQDWNYIHCGCFELTLEISDNKWPNATELPTLWGYNRMSMLKLASAVLKNVVHGKIFASDDGRPLPASITVKGINHTVKAGKPFADYHRLLAPGGKYEVTASAQGYRSRSTLIFLEEEDANMVDFILDPETSNHVEVQRVGCDCSSNMSSFEVMDIFVKPHLEVSLLVIVALLFFCFFLRKVNLDIRKRRQISGSKRPNVV